MALEELMRNRTSVVIAHRLSTIRKADKIVVMEKGVAIEEGTHETLIAKENGVYANLMETQQLG
jgi:ABC-type multidrug transport system fused ATPase/permease subunit